MRLHGRQGRYELLLPYAFVLSSALNRIEHTCCHSTCAAAIEQLAEIPSNSNNLRMQPRRSIRPAEEPVVIVVAPDSALVGVPGERVAELHGHVGQDAACGGDVALLDV